MSKDMSEQGKAPRKFPGHLSVSPHLHPLNPVFRLGRHGPSWGMAGHQHFLIALEVGVSTEEDL